jgi:23S rRNA (guanosine2251-2'-O)-methyltransferase
LAKIFSGKLRDKGFGSPGLVVGLVPVRAALLARGQKAEWLKVAKTRTPNPTLAEIFFLADQLGLQAQIVDRAELDRLSPAPHQGVAAQFPPVKPITFAKSQAVFQEPGPALLLALDHLEDPHNLGALWRTAAALGVKALVAPKDRAASLTEVVHKVAAGGAETTPLYEAVNLARALTELKDLGYWLVGAEAGQGQSLWDFAFPERAVLALGSEGRGLGRLVREKMDFLVHIPLGEAVDSLNVAAAGAIFMATYFKQWRR